MTNEHRKDEVTYNTIYILISTCNKSPFCALPLEQRFKNQTKQTYNNNTLCHSGKRLQCKRHTNWSTAYSQCGHSAT